MSEWKVIGLDTFEAAHDPKEAEYTIGTCVDEATAQSMAYSKLRALEVSQPSATSGGQHSNGIQDQVFIERPDGTRYRVTPCPRRA